MTHWIGKTKDGREVNEQTHSWSDVEGDLVELGFVLDDGKTISLPSNLPEYIQAKTASADMDGNNLQIESRYIGFCKDGLQILLRVDEKSSNITVEVESI